MASTTQLFKLSFKKPISSEFDFVKSKQLRYVFSYSEGFSNANQLDQSIVARARVEGLTEKKKKKKKKKKEMEFCRFGHGEFSKLATRLRNCECRFYGKIARYERFWPQKTSILLRKGSSDARIFPRSKGSHSGSDQSLYMECQRTP